MLEFDHRRVASLDTATLTSLRAAEVVAVSIAALVSIGTYLFVAGGVATEVTPTMAVVIDTVGWSAFTAGRLLPIAAVFAVLRYLERRDGQDWALVAGWFVAGGMVTNLLSDTWVMLAAASFGEVPDPAPVAATIVVAAAVLARPILPISACAPAVHRFKEEYT